MSLYKYKKQGYYARDCKSGKYIKLLRVLKNIL